MLTACSSEDDILQTGQTKKVAPQEVGFDVYTPAATDVTRAGQVGTMTTSRLQRTEGNKGGFGVYAYLTEDTDGSTTATAYTGRTTAVVPNFMVNEKLLWNATNLGWYYNPLKYWPNETDNDSQTSPAQMEGQPTSTQTHLDRLTFFAYAPYVGTAVADEVGITAVTNNAGKLSLTATGSETDATLREASIQYKATLDDPEKVVDLLWGTAPAGGLTYTAVNGNTVKVEEGEPLIDMVKPDVNTNMKFLFQHALARIGVKVRAAIDQVPAGGKLDENTKITIDNVTLTGMFGETGILNLDNSSANVANWVKINNTEISSSTKAIADKKTLTLSADAGTIAPWLRYKGEHNFGSYSEQTVDGVTTVNQDLITPRYYKLDEAPAYNPTKQYYTDAKATYTVKSTDDFYTQSGNAPGFNYAKVAADTKVTDGTNPGYYTLTVSGPYPQSGTMPTGGSDKLFYKLVGDDYQYVGKGSSITWEAGSSLIFYLLEAKAFEPSDFDFKYDDNKATATYTVTATDNIYVVDANGIYKKKESGSISAPAIGTSETSYYKLEVNKDCGTPTLQPDGTDGNTRFYTKDANGVFTHAGKGSTITWGSNSLQLYTVNAIALKSTDEPLKFEYTAPIFDKERNYFMVIPTNNVNTLNHGLTTKEDEDLRTIRVKIEYYITTEDNKIAGGRTQTKNVIEKDVVFPSLANGKSYNLNLVLGLTSVKVEAEVDDWKVVNVQADLPQNTAE